MTLDGEGGLFVDDQPTSIDSLTATISALREDRSALAVYADQDATIGILATVASAAAELDMRVAIATDASSP